jgi:maleylpyruvate isomerase
VVTQTSLDRDVAGAAAAHQGLLAMLDEQLNDGALDGSAPSRLPGWTIGHVLTHLARNADSMVRVLVAADRGEVIDRYEGGQARRDAEIEAGAPRPADELVADVRTTIWSLEQTWSTHTRWEGRSREAPGRESPVSELPFMRWREVEVHRTDLGLGYEPSDWPAEYVRRDLRLMEMRWNARRPMGMTGLPQAALDAPPYIRLAWLLGRTPIGDLEPAGVF